MDEHGIERGFEGGAMVLRVRLAPSPLDTGGEGTAPDTEPNVPGGHVVLELERRAGGGALAPLLALHDEGEDRDGWQGLVGCWRLGVRDLALPIERAHLLAQVRTLAPLAGWAAAPLAQATARLLGLRLGVLQHPEDVPPRLKRAASRILAEFGDRLYDAIDRPALPAFVGHALAGLLRPPLLPAGEPLWVDVDATYAEYLPLLPWERMLRAFVDVPILRLPYVAMDTPVGGDALTLVVCMSAPEGRPTIEAPRLWMALRRVQSALPDHSVIHVFADRGHFEALTRPRRSREDRTARVALHVHEPPPLPASREPSQSSDTARGVTSDHRVTMAGTGRGEDVPARAASRHPWTTWIRTVALDHAVDAVYWIAPGVLLNDGAVLAIASHPGASPAGKETDSPTAGVPLRYLTPQDAQDLLGASGGWATLLTSPAGAESRIAHRWFGDRLARLRPGPVLVHELSTDSAVMAGLDAGCRLLFARGGRRTVLPGSVVMYATPRVVGRSQGDGAAVVAVAAEDVPAGGGTAYRSLLAAYERTSAATQAVMAEEGPTPKWVAVGQRALEQVVSQFVGAGRRCGAGDASPLADSTCAGVADAMRLVSEMLQQTARPAPSVGAPMGTQSEDR